MKTGWMAAVAGTAAAFVGGTVMTVPAQAQEARPLTAMRRSSPRYVINTATGMCMTVHGGSKAKGAKVDLYRCVGAANQKWSMVPTGTVSQIVNLKSGLCLDVLGGKKSNGALLGQWTCNGSANQKFFLTHQAGGGFIIGASHTLKEVQPKYHDRRANNPLHQWGSNTRWARWHH